MDRRALLTLSLIAAAAPSVALATPSEGGGAVSDETYVTIDGLEASISHGRGRGRGVISVQVGIDVPDAALRERATQAAPRIRAACNQVLRAFGAALLPRRAPDADHLARELQAAVDAALGRQGARLLMGSIITT